MVPKASAAPAQQTKPCPNPRPSIHPLWVSLTWMASRGSAGGGRDWTWCLHAFRRGAAAQESAQPYPFISLSDPFTAISFDLQNKYAVDAYLEKPVKGTIEVQAADEKRFGQSEIRGRAPVRKSKRPCHPVPRTRISTTAWCAICRAGIPIWILSADRMPDEREVWIQIFRDGRHRWEEWSSHMIPQP